MREGFRVRLLDKLGHGAAQLHRARLGEAGRRRRAKNTALSKEKARARRSCEVVSETAL